MPSRRFDWHERVQQVEREYRVVQLAAERLSRQVFETHEVAGLQPREKAALRNVSEHLEGSYLVRMFAVFEAALRSHDRARHNDPDRTLDAGPLIDTTAGRRGVGISARVREFAHEVRELRNYWAHENDDKPNELTLPDARARLQQFLSWLPEQWD